MGFVEELGPESSEHFLHVARHGYGDSGAGGVESDVHAEVLIALGSNGDFIVVESQCFFQVIDVEVALLLFYPMGLKSTSSASIDLKL